jgi:hypothetical protein
MDMAAIPSGGLPGSGKDRAHLAVGDAVPGVSGSGFSYQAWGALSAGDLQLIGPSLH